MTTNFSDRDLQLVEAVKLGDFKTVVQLLADGADPNAKKKGKSCLELVSPLKHNITKALILAGARHVSLKHAMVWAVLEGGPDVVEILIDYGADLNKAAPVGTPLQAAAKKGCLRSVELLLSAGCDVKVTTLNETAISAAVEGRNPDILRRILDAGCPADIDSQAADSSPLHLAVEQNHLECLEILLAAGCDIHQKADKMLVTEELEQFPEVNPLHYATILNHPNQVQALLAAGADPGVKDGSGKTALDWARQKSLPELVSLLAIVTVETEPDADETLLLAAESGTLNQVKEALENGASLECRDARTQTKNYTPLLLAARAGHSNVALYLIESGADVNATEGGDKIPNYLLSQVDDPDDLSQIGYSFSRTALLWALINQQVPLARQLLEHGADPSLKSHLGEDAIGLAATLNSTEVLTALKDAGVKLDKAGRNRNTPLMAASESGALASVEWLLAHKAKVGKKNRDKETALHLACAHGHLEIARLLIEAGADVNAEAQFGTPLTKIAGAAEKIPFTSGVKQYISVVYGPDGAYTWRPLEEDRTLALVELLLESGADPNKGEYLAPLQASAQAGQLRVVKRLLEAGALQDRKDSLGNTPAQVAELFQQHEVASFLKAQKPGEDDSAPAPKAEVPESPFSGLSAKIPRVKRKMKSKAFRQAVLELENLCRSSAVFLDHGVECHLNSDQQEDLEIAKIQAQFAKLGYFLCDLTGSLEKPVKLGLFPVPDWQSAIALIGTNGINSNVGSQDIIDRLEDWCRKAALQVLTLKHDLVGGRFVEAFVEPEELAHSMYEICPDVVDQGFGELELLVESLQSDSGFLMWWD